MNKLISLATPEIREIAEPFIANHRAWAARNGYEYQCHEKLYFNDLHPSFSKTGLLLNALNEGADYVIWLDADVAMMTMDCDLKDIIASRLADRPELFLSAYQQANWTREKYLCAGIVVIKNCELARAFVAEWAKRCEFGSLYDAWGKPCTEPWRITYHCFEQWHLQHLAIESQYHGIYAATALEIGCFCPDLWHDGTVWTPKMPSIHFGGAPFEKRAEVFLKKYAKLVH